MASETIPSSGSPPIFPIFPFLRVMLLVLLHEISRTFILQPPASTTTSMLMTLHLTSVLDFCLIQDPDFRLSTCHLRLDVLTAFMYNLVGRALPIFSPLDVLVTISPCQLFLLPSFQLTRHSSTQPLKLDSPGWTTKPCSPRSQNLSQSPILPFLLQPMLHMQDHV